MSGVKSVVLALLIWGIAPIYFKLLKTVTPLEILAHRILWSFILLFVVVLWGRRFLVYKNMLLDLNKFSWPLLSTFLISSNWFVYIYSILEQRLLESSFGYFLSPFVNIILGMIFFREKLNINQRVSVVMTILAILVQFSGAGNFYNNFPWISIYLALSFSFYALVRKKINVDSMMGLTVETTILLPITLIYFYFLYHHGAIYGASYGVSAGTFLGKGQFFSTPLISFLLMMSGFVTAIPLMLFIEGTKKLPLSTVGFYQYISPTCQFLLAVVAFHEPLALNKIFSYILIWIALIFFVFDRRISWTHRVVEIVKVATKGWVERTR
ncbi:MAG: EamA family transporter RarD [Oligoflexia bacterium]|nr:EamA family transporter RarD [Oligoflexia bacterium]